MKPEDQNPTTNPLASAPASTPAPDATPTEPAAPVSADTTTPADIANPVDTTPAPDATLTADDHLAAAQENLTAAANATAPDTSSAPVDLSASTAATDLTADAGSTPSTPTFDEPLVPAAPVPGSIGSVTSVPPVAANPADAPADNAFAAAAAAEPAAAPFNPFAQDAAASAPNPTAPAPATSDPSGLNPAFQPAGPTTPATPVAKKPALSPKFLTLILGIAAGVFLIATIVMTILYINALNHKEIVYYPQATDPEPVVETLSCTQVLDLAYLAGYATPVNGNRIVTATYTDDALTAMTVNYDAAYGNDIDANTARANLEAAQIALVNTPESAFTAAYSTNGATMLAELQSVDDLLTNDAAETLLFGTVSGNPEAMTRANLEASLTAAGAVCTVE